MVVVVLDLPRLRTSSAIEPHWTDLSEHVQRVGSPPYSEVCPALTSTTPATIVATMSFDGEWTVWLLGAPSNAHRDCWVAHTTAHPDAIQIETRGNVMTTNVTAPRVRRTTSAPHRTIEHEGTDIIRHLRCDRDSLVQCTS